ncbi:hypothetical protein LCGC14_0426490 [marine sediment metagenome]|uniref:Uncharacterized protein n=1 Tax=marine sediment metagenome TaxID=412755 RepID=A0A0F9VBE7_9ZZZZ
MMEYPKHWQKRCNVCSEPCDMIDGPCCCGAWHDLKEEWVCSMIAEYGLTEINGLRMCFAVDKQLTWIGPIDAYTKLWESIKEGFLGEKQGPKHTVEENQKKRTDKNLGGVFG